MKADFPISRVLQGVALCIILAACQGHSVPGSALPTPAIAGATVSPSPTALASPSATASPETLLRPTATPTPWESPTAFSPTATSLPTPCTADLCYVPWALHLRRPIQPPGNDSVDVTYRFGSTQGGLRDPHHGVEFLNSFGTPVVAAGEGVVVVAGSDRDPISPPGDWPILFYGPYANFYGNLVVIEHSPPAALFALYPDLPTPLYTLYGHLSEVLVQVGQTVQAGQLIGRVGMSGVATGNHLHFEVRLGENTYKAAHNPELWLAPHTDAQGQPTGALAGRFLNTYQVSLEIEEIVLEYLPQGPEGESAFEIALRTYEEKALLGRPPFWESFGVGDLPAGLYRLTFPLNGLRREWITIYPGQITVVTFRK